MTVRLSFKSRSVIHLLLVVMLRPARWQRSRIPLKFGVSFFVIVQVVFDELWHAWLARVGVKIAACGLLLVHRQCRSCLIVYVSVKVHN